MTWWSPIDIDGNLVTVRSGGGITEKRDAIAFALDTWAGNDATAEDGSGAAGQSLRVSDLFDHKSGPSRVLLGYGGDDTITGTDTPEMEGLNRHSRTRGYVGHSDTPDDPRTGTNDFQGDKVYAGQGDILMSLLGGDNFGFGNDGADTLQGGPGHDVLVGGRGDDLLFGGAGDDVLQGGDGADRRDDGAGHDLHDCGAGADTFFFADGGSARIRDFDFSQDRVDLSDWGVAHFDDLAIALEDAGKLYVRHEANIARFDATVDAFGAEHFTLAGDPAAFA